MNNETSDTLKVGDLIMIVNRWTHVPMEGIKRVTHISETGDTTYVFLPQSEHEQLLQRNHILLWMSCYDRPDTIMMKYIEVLSSNLL